MIDGGPNDQFSTRSSFLTIRVFGQFDFGHQTANSVDAAGFFSPTAVAVDKSFSPNRLYIADSNNHRVLGYLNAASFLNGASADLVIGQPDFLVGLCNNGGCRKDGKCCLSGKTKGHIKGLMHVRFDRAMFWGYLPISRNPMELVTIKGGTKRTARPKVLSQEQFGILLQHVEEDYVRLVVIIAMCLGLRFSGVLALKWMDVNWEALTIYVRRGIVLGRVDETKTEYSEAPAPLDPSLAEAMLTWKRKSEFAGEQDWVFASPFAAGKKPYFSTGVRRKIHAAARKLASHIC